MPVNVLNSSSIRDVSGLIQYFDRVSDGTC